MKKRKVIVGADYLQQVLLDVEDGDVRGTSTMSTNYISSMIRAHRDAEDFVVDPFFRYPVDASKYILDTKHGGTMHIKPINIKYTDKKALKDLVKLRDLAQNKLIPERAKDIPDHLLELNGIISRHNSNHVSIMNGTKLLNKQQIISYLKKRIHGDLDSKTNISVSTLARQLDTVTDSKNNSYTLDTAGNISPANSQDCLNIVQDAERVLRINIFTKIGFKTCKRCKRQILQIDTFCPYCGKKQEGFSL